jgi:hypothetical protein
MTVNIEQVRTYLQTFDFKRLFVEELGWSSPVAKQPESLDYEGVSFEARHLAELSGVVVLEVSAADGVMPVSKARAALHKEIAKRYHENLLVFVDAARAQSLWYWVKREQGKKFPREHLYVKGQPGDLFISKISGIVFDISDFDASGNVSIVNVAKSLKNALDVERVTKRFYEEFKSVRLDFTDLIEGIPDERERRWYASVMLNRLMFIYFLQSKGFVDDERRRYLQEHLTASPARFGSDQYYKQFLKPLFFEGFAKPEAERSQQVRQLLGNIVYLNGGLFLEHVIEEKNRSIRIPDQAFTNLFELFGDYSWNLNDTPGGDDNEINPDVLGYIFEKYINQKAFGAYYTRPEITEYLCEHTIHQLILDKVNPGMNIPGLPAPRRFESLADMLLNLDTPLCRRLLFDVLPNLSLLDPACGSGAFLVAAMKTLINVYSAVTGRIDYLHDAHLAEWLRKTRAEHKSLNYFIKRTIITNNLFGVDIMEEACEIAKLRLFLALVSSAQSVDQLEPLPNIDFNILPGNSLIGLLRVNDVDFDKQSAQGSLAFNQSYHEVLEEKNRLIRDYRNTATFHRDLQTMRDNINEKKAEAKETLDALLLEEFVRLGVRYEQATWDTAKGIEGKPQKRALNLTDIRTLRPLHWGYEFDEVLHGRGGFDAIIANPPWETFKPNAKEFFMEHSELVTKNKMTIKEFEEKQDELLQDPAIHAAWLKYLSQFPYVSAYYRSAKQYENQISVVNGKKAGTDINLYKLFVEQCYNLLRPGGQCGIIIPSGIYTDLGTMQMRDTLLSKCKVRTLFGFSNEKFIFENVHHSVRFAIIVFEKGNFTTEIEAAFRINPREAVSNDRLRDFLRANEQHIRIPVELIRRLCPDTLSIMEFRGAMDVQIVEKMLRFPLLGEKIVGLWNLILTNEFHMTNDSKLFHTVPGPTRLPLFTGKMFNQYTLTSEHSGYWIDEQQGRESLSGKSGDKSQALDYEGYRWVHRRIARNTDSRTMISTLTPRNVFTEVNSTTIKVRAAGISNAEMLVLCAFMNSMVLDWVLRQKVSSTLNMFYVYQLPMPRLTARDKAFRSIMERAARLVCTTPEYDDLAREVGITPLMSNSLSTKVVGVGDVSGLLASAPQLFEPAQPALGDDIPADVAANHSDHASAPSIPVYGVTDPVERACLRAELDGLVAHLYGLSHDEFAHILASFPLVTDDVKGAALSAFRDVSQGLIK